MLHRRLIWEWLLITAVSSAFVLWAIHGRLTESFDNWLIERISSTFAAPPDERILIVEIDNQSLRALGKWPWPRAIHAAAIDRIAAGQPRSIAYDILFLESDPDDAKLAQSIRRAGNVYLPALADPGVNTPSRTPLAEPVEPLASSAREIGIAEVLPDSDGVVRKAELAVKLAGKRMAQLTALIADDMGHRPKAWLTDEKFLFPYQAPGAFRHVSFSTILAGEVPPSLLRDRIVFVGATAEGMGDIYAVPAAAGDLMPGIEIQANTLNALLHDNVIRVLSSTYGVALSLAAVLGVMIGFLRTRPSRHPLIALYLMTLVTTGCIAMVPIGHIWLSPGPALLAIPLAYTLWAWRRLAAISRFLSREADEIRRDPAIAASSDTRELIGDPLTHEADALSDVIDQLRKVRALIGEVIEELPDATCVVDHTGTISIGNAAAARLYGAAVEGLPYTKFALAICASHTPGTTVLRREDGTILMASEAAFSHGGRIIRLADVTALQRDADEREEMLQFLSHDLRAPNASILMLLQQRDAKAELDQNNDGREASLRDRIRAQANLGLSLADDFAQLVRARRRVIMMEPVDLADVAREAADTLWPKANEEQIRLVEIARANNVLTESWVMGDRSMLLRAAINLFDNAVKFAPPGASVTYDVTPDDASETVRLTVSGPGPDLPPARQDNPFKLYAAGRDGSGSGSLGLGLAFVQTCVKRHGGSAHYARITDYGAAFSFSIPAAPIEPE